MKADPNDRRTGGARLRPIAAALWLTTLAVGAGSVRGDLIVTAPAPVTVSPDQEFTLTFTVQNTGTVTLVPTQDFAVVIVSTGIPATIVLTSEAPDAPPLTPNQTFDVPLSFRATTLPSGVNQAVNTVELQTFYIDPGTGQSFEPVGSTTVTVEAQPVALVPEPSTLALGLAGSLAALGGWQRRARSASSRRSAK